MIQAHAPAQSLARRKIQQPLHRTLPSRFHALVSVCPCLPNHCVSLQHTTTDTASCSVAVLRHAPAPVNASPRLGSVQFVQDTGTEGYYHGRSE